MEREGQPVLFAPEPQTRAPQTLLVLAGLPGSGKSTLAARFRESGWAVISQDELGDRKKCEAACSRALAAGQSVVVDRCNHNMAQRRHWIELARRQRQAGGVPIRLLALCIELPPEVCLQRASQRDGHATLPGWQAEDVIQRFLSEWQYPQGKEGFDGVQVARSSEQAAAVVTQLLAQHAPAAAGAAAVTVQAAAAQLADAPMAAPGAWSAGALPATTFAAGGHAHPQQLSADALAFQPGAPLLLQQPAQQQGWMQQQRQHYHGSRADAASSWRPSEPGGHDEPEQPAVPRSPRRGQRAGGHPQPAAQRWQPAPGSPARPAGAAEGQGGAPGAGGGNIVPFPGRQSQGRRQRSPAPPHLPRRHPWSRHGYDEPSGLVLDAGTDPGKVVLMFDANGCITSHTSMRRSAGVHKARPGIRHLRRLKDSFHLGMFSSASPRTVQVALELLEEAAGPGEPLFDRRLTLCRTHTFLAPLEHVAAGGKEWDTVKPLRPYFSRLHRVLLVDDDAHKAVAGEEGNMVLMPVWEADDPADGMVERLVDVLLALAEGLGGDPEGDARRLAPRASQQLAAAAAEARERPARDPAPAAPAPADDAAEHSEDPGAPLPVS